jgi:hypothetical protein
MKLKNGPLQRAGYDRDATTPFMQNQIDETSGEPQTFGAGEFRDLEIAGIKGEAGGLVPASYLVKAGVPGYEGKKGKWTISEEEAKQVRAYRASKGL